MHNVPTDLGLLVTLSLIAVAGNAACVAVYLALRPDAPAALQRVRRWLQSVREPG